MHFVVHSAAVDRYVSSTDAKALDVGGSSAALALVLLFEV